MMRHPYRTARYLASWMRGRGRIERLEAEMSREGRPLPVSVTVPEGGTGPYPSWIVLHGMTRRGRDHAQLTRFVRALASSGAVVLVPEIPEWIALELAPEVTVPTVRGALDLLPTLPQADPGRAALVGFSFGSPQALLAATDPSVWPDLAGVVGFGGYHDLERTLRFQLTGLHEWKGTLHRLRPDPYGRWIVGANFLTGIPGYEWAGAVSEALLKLASEAGDLQIPARHPTLSARAAELRRRLGPPDQELFDLFAGPDGVDPEPAAVEDLVLGLTEAARRARPLMDPAGRLGGVARPVHLLHGREDRLIPFTESLRLCKGLPADLETRCTVTRLFAHSKGEPLPRPWTLARETAAFLAAMDGILGAPDVNG